MFLTNKWLLVSPVTSFWCVKDDTWFQWWPHPPRPQSRTVNVLEVLTSRTGGSDTFPIVSESWNSTHKSRNTLYDDPWCDRNKILESTWSGTITILKVLTSRTSCSCHTYARAKICHTSIESCKMLINDTRKPHPPDLQNVLYRSTGGVRQFFFCREIQSKSKVTPPNLKGFGEETTHYVEIFEGKTR